MRSSVFAAWTIVFALVSGCSATNTVPSASDVVSIELCLGPTNCDQGKLKVTDRGSIELIVKEYSSLKDGWKTAQYFALTRGWLTTPTFSNSAIFYGREAQMIHVLFFDTALIAGRAVPNNNGDAYREPSKELLSALLYAKHHREDAQPGIPADVSRAAREPRR